MNTTDICNLALANIGQGTIDSLDEASEPARQCKLHYSHERKQLLGMFRWNFAERTEKLAMLAEENIKWKYVYAYPSRCLIIHSVYSKEDVDIKDMHPNEFEVFMVNESVQAIGSNVEMAYCDYTADVSNADVFPEEFVEALARKLAASIAIPLSASPELLKNNYQLYQGALLGAKFHAIRQEERKTNYPSGYTDARY